MYEPVETLDILKERLGTFMAQYNEMVRGGNMDLVFFKVRGQNFHGADLKFSGTFLLGLDLTYTLPTACNFSCFISKK